jgi:hypothetical protein
MQLNLPPCPDYFSTSVTSGGVARLAGVSYKDTVVRNAAISHKTMETLALCGAINPQRSLLPTDISANYLLKDWQQKDYITFWHLVISGVRPTNFRRLRLALDRACVDCRVDVDLLNNSRALASQRAPQHYKLTSAVKQAIDSTKSGVSFPVSRVVNLNDTDRSLGCRAERDLAGRLGIPSCAIQSSSGLSTDDDWICHLGEVSDDVRAVLRAGGHLSILRPGMAFSIVQIPEIFGESDTHLRATDIRDLTSVRRAFNSAERCMSENARRTLGVATVKLHLNPITGSSLPMSIKNSNGVNGAVLEDGQTDFVANSIDSTVEALQLLVGPARSRGNRPPFVISVRSGDERTEEACLMAGLSPIGGNLWSLA